MQFCDSHIHLLAPEWSQPVAERVRKAVDSNIMLLLQPGVRAEDWAALLQLARQHPEVYAAPGLHPLAAAEWNPAVAVQLEALCAQPKVVAIGEIGLDATLQVDMPLQRQAFSAQLEIAQAAKLPVLLHCRKRTDELLHCLKRCGISQIGGVLHGFSGSLETARQAIELGLLLGVGPVLLQENARRLPEVVKAVPAESLLLETDAPDQAASPAVLLQVASRLAELRGWSLEETATMTTANARRLMKI